MCVCNDVCMCMCVYAYITVCLKFYVSFRIEFTVSFLSNVLVPCGYIKVPPENIYILNYMPFFTEMKVGNQ